MFFPLIGVCFFVIRLSDNTRAIYDRDGKAARYEGYVTDIIDQMQA
jgi:hypothetical protein